MESVFTTIQHDFNAEFTERDAEGKITDRVNEVLNAQFGINPSKKRAGESERAPISQLTLKRLSALIFYREIKC